MVFWDRRQILTDAGFVKEMGIPVSLSQGSTRRSSSTAQVCICDFNEVFERGGGVNAE